jgi:hypothetical protein
MTESYGTSGNKTATNKSNSPDGEQEKEYQHKSWSDSAEILARWVVDLFAIPASFLAAILFQFLDRNGSGRKVLGALGFWIGTLLSTDGIWQTFFQGVPLFPWFESQWIGWTGWLILPLNPLFWISLAISALIQRQEAQTLRSKAPAEAKKEFEEAKQFTLPEKPKNTIDLTRALWGQYKRAGMRERKSGGLLALFFWLFDITTTFVSRWPFKYTNPAMILACLTYNVGTMMAGETGYHIWKHSKD